MSFNVSFYCQDISIRYRQLSFTIIKWNITQSEYNNKLKLSRLNKGMFWLNSKKNLFKTYLFNKYLLKTYEVPGNFLGTGKKAVNKIRVLTITFLSF